MPRRSASPRPSSANGPVRQQDRRDEQPRRRDDRDRNGGRRDDRGSGTGARRGEDERSGHDRRNYDRGNDRRDDRRDDRRGDPRDERRDRDRGHDRPHRRSRSPRQRSPPPPPPALHRPISPSPSHPQDHNEDHDKDKDINKGKPNFKPSGLLAADTKTVKSADGTKTVLKYHEPPEARKPLVGWRLYVFKGSEQTDLLHIQKQSAYLVGRDKTVVDIPVEHPSCSKQHAVIQYRYIKERSEYGDTKGIIKPYIIDLESTNGTSVNGETIPPAKYYELQVNDVIKFGDSLREYVLLHDGAS